MSPDEQEARWRRYSNDVIKLLPLKSGRIAVFNRGGDLCGIYFGDRISELMELWYPPAKREARPNPTLEELFK